MRTIALRFAENFAPDGGTIAAHQEVIDREGSVRYGKFGNPVSLAAADAIVKADDLRMPLIRSGGTERWWALLDKIWRVSPAERLIPPYYERVRDKFSCWFHVTGFERALKDVMSRCVITFPGRPLSIASRHCMCPYFIIDFLPSLSTPSGCAKEARRLGQKRRRCVYNYREAGRPRADAGAERKEEDGMDLDMDGISPEQAEKAKAVTTEEDFEALVREGGYVLSDKHLEDIAGGRIDKRVTKCFATHHC